LPQFRVLLDIGQQRANSTDDCTLHSNCCENLEVADFKLSRSFVVDADSALWFQHCVNVGSIGSVLEIYAASSFRVEVCRMDECTSVYRLLRMQDILHPACVAFGPSPVWALDQTAL
jgi:hypothetical protein